MRPRTHRGPRMNPVALVRADLSMAGSRARGACDMGHAWAPADLPATLAQANMPRLTMEDEWEANPDIAAEVEKEIDEYKWF